MPTNMRCGNGIFALVRQRNDSRDVSWRQQCHRRRLMEQVSRDQDPSGVWLGRWSRRLAVGHLHLKLPQPAIGASENLCGAALVVTVYGGASYFFRKSQGRLKRRPMRIWWVVRLVSVAFTIMASRGIARHGCCGGGHCSSKVSALK